MKTEKVVLHGLIAKKITQQLYDIGIDLGNPLSICIEVIKDEDEKRSGCKPI